MSATNFAPNLVLEGTGRFGRDINESIKEVAAKLTNIDQRIATLNEQFDNLQVLANDVAEKYEKTASRPDSYLDRKSLLQTILDHRLSTEDISLLCRYIRYLEKLILRKVWKLDSKYTRIRSVPQIHRERRNDWGLFLAYNGVCKKLGISNSGKPDSHIYILFSFLQDCLPQPRKTNTTRRMSNFYTHKMNQNPNEPLLPKSAGNLSDEHVAEHAMYVISTGVQDIQLVEALTACVLAVKRYFTKVKT
ncbi:uncharacterized protein LOC100177486 [Ciona intestinalis]